MLPLAPQVRRSEIRELESAIAIDLPPPEGAGDEGSSFLGRGRSQAIRVFAHG